MASGSKLHLAIGAVVFALLSVPITLAQLDRSARFNLAAASIVPSGLGGFADARMAAYLVESNPAAAQALMEGVIEQRPTDVSTLGLFARAAAENDEMDLASQALTLAAGRGWRDAYVQITVYGSALAQGNYEAASLRLEALARGQRDQSVVSLAIAQLQADPEGRRVLAERLAESPGFEKHFASAVRAYEDRIGEFAQTAAIAESLGAHIDCEIAADITIRALNAANAEAARNAWPDRCRKDVGETNAFVFGSQPNPFGWTLVDTPGVSTRPGNEEGTLYLKNRDLVERPIATKFLQLGEGRYSLALQSEARTGRTPFDAPAQLSARMGCGSRTSGTPIVLEERGGDVFGFEVGPDCGTQYLLISARRGERRSLEVVIRPES